ncbi:MAG: MBL fold metallo-hydrolase [Alphaproteobacteria bacterium]
MSTLKFTILGCGNSTGVPAIGNFWGDCDPKEPKNRRTRSSLLVQSDETTLVIDTGPDFRNQLNRENINNINAVLYTHQHSDHVIGMDELRVLKFRNKKEFMPIYSNEITLNELESRFYYLFKGGNHEIYPPIVQKNIISDDQFGHVQQIGDIEFIPFKQDHGSCMSLGYRFGDTAYSIDILDLNDTAIETLRGIRTWIVDCAAYKDNNNAVHASLDKIIALNDRIKAENVFLSSLSLSADYQSLLNDLPAGFAPCYDGMVVNEHIA